MKESLTELFNTQYDAMVKRMSGWVGGKVNAEDVVQEAFTRALKYSATYHSQQDLEGWFYTILNNSARDFKKQERLDGMTRYEEDEEPTYMSPEELEQRLWLVDAIKEEMAGRPDLHYDVLKGYFLLGWKPKEIMQYSPLKGPHIRKIIERFKDDMQEKYGADLRS